MVLGLVGVLTVMIGWSKAKEEPATKKIVTKKIDNEREIAAQEMKLGKIEVINLGENLKLEMVLIPAGKFIMGSPESEKGRLYNEMQHEVTLTKPFYMGKYEVTQEQWVSVMGSNPSDTKGANLPVTQVS
jgi:formylglycine-generating enzyme required for sulfatase activity